MPDQNDIVFSQNSIDIVAVFKAVLKAVGFDDLGFSSVLSFVNTTWDIFVILSFLLAALLLFGFIYASLRFNELSAIQVEEIKKLEEMYKSMYGAGTQNSRIIDVETHISSSNPNDWKLAIIEADIILEKILDNSGYAGITIGDKLKSASPTQFSTLDDAWEAHKVRNRIAHEGGDFVLTRKLAQDTIQRYKRVFAEFGEV
ncbi:hypothetical protein CL653_01610 [bacterium]|nr:hypothetical protein [bacterium]